MATKVNTLFPSPLNQALPILFRSGHHTHLDRLTEVRESFSTTTSPDRAVSSNPITMTLLAEELLQKGWRLPICCDCIQGHARSVLGQSCLEPDQVVGIDNQS